MTESQSQTTNTSPPVSQPLKAKPGAIFSSWKFKASLVISLVAITFTALFLVGFFWAHFVAGIGVKDWSSRAGASPIECMIKDTNDDGYVSCSAMLKGEVVPLECGSSIFNIGCRVNYGAAAAPNVRSTIVPNGKR